MRAQKSERANYNTHNKSMYKSTNCLCERCNWHQQLKMEKLSNFEPKNEVKLLKRQPKLSELKSKRFFCL